jgi:hypothetical protein
MNGNTETTKTMSKEEMLLNLLATIIVAVMKVTPEVIIEIQNSTAENKDQLIADIKTAQSQWPEWK